MHTEGAFKDSHIFAVQQLPRERSASAISSWDATFPVANYPLGWFSRVTAVRFVDTSILRVEGPQLLTDAPVVYEITIVRQTNSPPGTFVAGQLID